MVDLKTTTLVINAKLKITIPASLNEAQQASIVNDLVSDDFGTVESGVMDFSLKAHMQQVDDWSPKQLVTSSLWISKTDFSEDPPKQEKSSTTDFLFQEAEALNNARESLTSRMNAKFISMADKMIENGNIDELRTLIDDMPSCPTRMTLAGKLQNSLLTNLIK